MELSVFQKILRHIYFQMPDILRKIHGLAPSAEFHGEMEMIRSRNPFSKFLLFFINIPSDGACFDISRKVRGDRVLISRTTKHKNYETQHFEKDGKLLIIYKYRKFVFDLTLTDKLLQYKCKRTFLFNVPIPMFLSYRPHLTVMALDQNSWLETLNISFLGIRLFRMKITYTLDQ